MQCLQQQPVHFQTFLINLQIFLNILIVSSAKSSFDMLSVLVTVSTTSKYNLVHVPYSLKFAE
jgi:hypothetical protein